MSRKFQFDDYDDSDYISKRKGNKPQRGGKRQYNDDSSDEWPIQNFANDRYNSFDNPRR